MPQSNISSNLESFLENAEKSNPNEPEFIQVVKEVFEDVFPFIQNHPKYLEHSIPERLAMPDRIHQFRVSWQDDNGAYRVNRGYRVQFNNALGPYKGGLRFDPSVNPSVLKFLAFEQIFKNALTGLPLGAGKGGADFDPSDKSDSEIMRFCQAFMDGLHHSIGENTDVPAGDMGVGAKEIGYLFGRYKFLTKQYTGVLTGKDSAWGGSKLREEATGYGLVYFLREMLKTQNEKLEQKKIIISGAGNVALHAAAEAIQLGAKVIALSDSTGLLHLPDGLTNEQWLHLYQLKHEDGESLEAFTDKFDNATFESDATPWSLKADIALPCATQNELNQKDAEKLVKNQISMIAEGANMACTPDAIRVFSENKVLFGPGKAANAGGVAVSGLEMTQNSIRLSWSNKKVDKSLRKIMQSIHKSCLKHSSKNEFINYSKGANIEGFKRVADAMIDQGLY